MEERRRERREMDIEFYESSYKDALRDVLKQRKERREYITELLLTKLPSRPEDFLTLDQKRLLSTPIAFLSPEERKQVVKIRNEMDNIVDEEGTCPPLENHIYTGDLSNPDYVFKITIPGFAYSFCFNIYDIFIDGLVNEDLGLADVRIILTDTRENYLYPLNKDEFERLLGKAGMLGIFAGDYPRMRFPVLQEAKLALIRLKAGYELN